MCESEPSILLEHLYCVTICVLHAMLVASYSSPTFTLFLAVLSWYYDKYHHL